MAVELKKVKHPINGFNWSGVRTDCHPTSPTWSHGQQTKRKQTFGTLRLAGRWIYFIFPLHRIFNIFSQLFQVLADSHATWECPALHFIRKWLKFSSDLKVKIGPVPLNRPLNFFENFENFVVDRCLFLMTRSFISDRFIQKCWAGNPQKVRNYFPIRKRNCAIELKLKCRSMKSETRSRPVTFRLVSHFNFDEINKLIRRSQRDGRYAQNQFHAAVRARRSRGRRNLNFSDIF